MQPIDVSFSVQDFAYLTAIASALTVMTAIYSIILIASMWKLFKKEGIKPWFSLVPFLNVYKLLKICKIPFWLIFVPLVNLLVLLLYPYKLARQYQLSKFLSFLTVIFPYGFIPYIAFSKLENKDKKYNPNFLKTIEDVNNLENNLTNNNDTIIDDAIFDKKVVKEESHINDFVEKIDSTIINDEIVYDEPEKIEESKEEQPVREFVDLNDDNPMSLDDVEVLEGEINVNINQEKKVLKDIKEYKEIGPKDEIIAFGGALGEEDKSIAKVEELKCPRCGASLVGSNGFCPGCGLKL